jgi:hypothetical protein
LKQQKVLQKKVGLLHHVPNNMNREFKTTQEILAEAIEMVQPIELRETIKKAFNQWLDEQIAHLEGKHE